MGCRAADIARINNVRSLIVDGYKNGEGYAALATQYHVGQQTAKRLIQEAGIEIRSVAKPGKLKKCTRCGDEFLGTNNCQKNCENCKTLAKLESNRLRMAERWADPIEREIIQNTALRHRETNIEKIKKKARDKSASVKRFTDSVKLTAGCMDCGYNERAIAMDFDHLPEFEKTKMVTHCKTIRRAVEEIMKCEVVCANCHRIRTEDRGNYGQRHCDC